MNKNLVFISFIFIISLIGIPSVLAIDSYKPYMHNPSVPEHPKILIQGSYETALWPGAATYSYPIELPPGRNGVAPQLSLEYTSQSTLQRPGIVGNSWSLTQNYIYRDTSHTDTNASDDEFKMFLDGRFYSLVYSSADGRYHTEIESNLYINKFTGGNNTYDDYWIVRMKDGTRYRFGDTPDSELVSNMHSYAVRWSLNLITDIHGNSIYYTYNENPNSGDFGAVYPDKIEYNNQKERVVEFILENSTRLDNWLVYENGYKARESRRIGQIIISANGSFVRRYVLNYITLDVASRSFLSSVTLYGSDNVSTLFPAKFEYYSPVAGWDLSQDFITSVPFEDTSANGTTSDNGARLVDLNRDGLVDIVRGRESETSEARINNGSGWVSNPSWIVPINSVNSLGLDIGTRFVDFDGDGLTDVVRADGSTRDSRRNTGNTANLWVVNTTWNLPAEAFFVNRTANINETGTVFADVNGDGLQDIISSTDDWNRIWINKKNGWILDNSWKIPIGAEFITYPQGIDLGVRVDDLNGDGFPDLVKAKGSSMVNHTTWINNGTGWVSDPSWRIPLGLEFVPNSGSNDNGMRLADLNGDGLTDVIKSTATNKQAWINNGTGWKQNNSWNLPENANFIISGSNKVVRLVDANGDGVIDVMNGGLEFSKTYLNKASKPYLLKKVTNNIGGFNIIDFIPSTKFNNAGQDSLSDLGFNVWVVNNVLDQNGMTNSHNVSATTYYFYKGGLFDYASKEFGGFGEVYENLFNVSVTKHSFHQTQGLRGKEYATDIYDRYSTSIYNGVPAYNFYQTTYFGWAQTFQNGYFIANLANETTHLYDKSYIPKTTQNFYSYDGYGNIVSSIQKGDTNITGDERYEYWDFVYNITLWIVNTPKRYTSYDTDNSTLVRATFYRYDNQSYGANPSKGDLTWEENWLNTGSNATTKYDYDIFGNVIKESNPNGQNTTYTYGLRDTTFTFADQITNTKGHILNYNHNLGTGNLLSETDGNNYITNYTYDTFGRITKEIKPYDSTTYPTKVYNYIFDGSAPESIKVSQRETNGTSNTFDSIFIYDGLGDLIQMRAEGEGNTVVTDLFYDGAKRITKQSNPYFAQSGDSYTNPNPSVSSTSYQYDSLSRITKVINPDGTAKTTDFDRWRITSTDENGNKKVYYQDGYNQIIKVIEYIGNNYFTTSYGYTSTGEITQINDSHGATIEYQYDTLGRKISENNSDIGFWQYTYDNAGNLIKQIDSKGTNVILTYDSLSRLTNKTSSSEFVIYSYDFINGTLSNTTTSDFVMLYGYDQRLRKVNNTMQIDGKSLTKKWTYDSLDRVASETMPDNSVISYTYTLQNQIKTVDNVLSDVKYNSLSKPLELSYVNNLKTNLTYNLNTFRVDKIKTGSYQDMVYSYDSVGNVININDTVTSTNKKITYDKLDRISSAEVTNGSQTSLFNYSQNAQGNMLISKEDTNVTYYYGAAPVHAPRKIVLGFPVNSPPSIAFVSPTPLNGTSQNITSIYVNISSNDIDDHYVFVDFDKTNKLWMRMDDVNASGDPIDLSSYSRNGSHYGNATQTEDGKYGISFSFDGNGDSIQAGGPVTNRIDNVSISLWVKWAGSTGSNQIMVYNGNTANNGFGLRLDSSRGNQYELLIGGVGYVETSDTLAPNVWTHLAAVRSKGDWLIYKDGFSVNITSGSTLTPNIPTGKFYMGVSSSESAFFNGSIDEVTVFDRALSQREVRSLYNAKGLYQYFKNFTDSTGDDVHKFRGYAVDLWGEISKTEEREITIKSLLDITKFDVVYINNTGRVFNFVINNTLSFLISNISWSLDTGNGVESSQYNATLQGGENVIVFVYHNYTASGNYTVRATAQNVQYSDTEVMTITI